MGHSRQPPRKERFLYNLHHVDIRHAKRAVTHCVRSIRHTKIFDLYRYLYVCEQIKENFPTLFIISIFQTLFPFFSVNLSTKEEN